MELSSFVNIKGTSFVFDALKNVEDMIIYCSYSMEPFFCSRRGDLVVIIKVYGV